MLTDADRDSILSNLKARQQIQDAVVRYSRGVDRCDRDAVLQAYHEDGWDDHGMFRGSPAEFADWAIALHLESFVWTTHYVTNHYVEFHGEEARAETHVQGVLRFERDGSLYDLWAAGRYLDVLTQRDGTWKIQTRRVTADWNRIDRVEERPEGALVEMLLAGTRGSDDPSYAHFMQITPRGSGAGTRFASQQG